MKNILSPLLSLLLIISPLSSAEYEVPYDPCPPCEFVNIPPPCGPCVGDTVPPPCGPCIIEGVPPPCGPCIIECVPPPCSPCYEGDAYICCSRCAPQIIAGIIIGTALFVAMIAAVVGESDSSHSH